MRYQREVIAFPIELVSDNWKPFLKLPVPFRKLCPQYVRELVRGWSGAWNLAREIAGHEPRRTPREESRFAGSVAASYRNPATFDK